MCWSDRIRFFCLVVGTVLLTGQLEVFVGVFNWWGALNIHWCLGHLLAWLPREIGGEQQVFQRENHLIRKGSNRSSDCIVNKTCVPLFCFGMEPAARFGGISYMNNNDPRARLGVSTYEFVCRASERSIFGACSNWTFWLGLLVRCRKVYLRANCCFFLFVRSFECSSTPSRSALSLKRIPILCVLKKGNL